MLPKPPRVCAGAGEQLPNQLRGLLEAVLNAATFAPIAAQHATTGCSSPTLIFLRPQLGMAKAALKCARAQVVFGKAKALHHRMQRSLVARMHDWRWCRCEHIPEHVRSLLSGLLHGLLLRNTAGPARARLLLLLLLSLGSWQLLLLLLLLGCSSCSGLLPACLLLLLALND